MHGFDSFLHHAFAWTGTFNESGGWYGFWSGFAGGFGILTIVIIGYRKINCHTQKCWRIGHHDLVVKHSPTDPARRIKFVATVTRDPGQAFLARRTTSNAPRSRGRECAMTWWIDGYGRPAGQVAFPATSSPRSFGHSPAIITVLAWRHFVVCYGKCSVCTPCTPNSTTSSSNTLPSRTKFPVSRLSTSQASDVARRYADTTANRAEPTELIFCHAASVRRQIQPLATRRDRSRTVTAS